MPWRERPIATITIVTIVGNLYSLLRQHLRGTPCSVYFADIYELHGFQTDAVYKLAIGLDF